MGSALHYNLGLRRAVKGNLCPFFDRKQIHICNIRRFKTRASRKGDRFCQHTNESIPASKVCNGMINCKDGSDEFNCTCRERLDPLKLCDNYYDCLDMSDEVGCFGCASKISCRDNNNARNNAMNNSSQQCFSKSQRCDGFENCANGKDEKDCYRMVEQEDRVSYLLSVY